MAPAQNLFNDEGSAGQPHDGNNGLRPNNNYTTMVATSNSDSPGREGNVVVGGRGSFLHVRSAIQVKTGASVNESVNSPFMGQRGTDVAQQQQHINNNTMSMRRSSSHPSMFSTSMNVDDSNNTEPTASTDRIWANSMMDMDDGGEPLIFNFDTAASPDFLNEGKGINRVRGNQRSHSEPALSLLADVFDAIDADFNENIQMGGLESAVDGWTSPSPPMFDVPPTRIMQPSRKRSSSEPFVISDVLDDLRNLEPDNLFDDRGGGSNNNSATHTVRSATAPPEWGDLDELCTRKAKRGSSFSMGQVLYNHEQQPRQSIDYLLFGQTPFTDTNPSSPTEQAGNAPMLNDFTLALFAVQETQTNLRTLQPMIMQLGNLAAMEEISIASKLTASSSQYILANDLPSVYSCLNGAWERIKKLEDLISMSAAMGRQQQEPQQQQSQGGHNDLSELQMMLTHGGTGALSPGGGGGGVASHASPMAALTTHCPPLPPLQPIPNNNDIFAKFVLATAHENEIAGQESRSASELGMVSSTSRDEPIMVNMMSPKRTSKSKLCTSLTQSLTSLPSSGKNVDVQDLPPPSNTDPEIIMKRLQALMERTQMSQKRLQVSSVYYMLLFGRRETLLPIFSM